MKFCKRCKRQVITFRQEHTTMPQDNDNKIRRYKEEFCSLCGYCIHDETVDEVVK